MPLDQANSKLTKEEDLALPSITASDLAKYSILKLSQILPSGLDLLVIPQTHQNSSKLDTEKSQALLKGLEQIEKLGTFKVELFHPENTNEGEMLNPLILIGQFHSEPDGSIPSQSLKHQFQVCKAVKILHDHGIDRLYMEGVMNLSDKMNAAEVDKHKEELANYPRLDNSHVGYKNSLKNGLELLTDESKFTQEMSARKEKELAIILSIAYLNDPSLQITGMENPETKGRFAGFYNEISANYTEGNNVYKRLFNLQGPLDISVEQDEVGKVSKIKLIDQTGKIEFINSKNEFSAFKKVIESIVLAVDSSPEMVASVGTSEARENYVANKIAGPAMVVIGQSHVANFESYKNKRSIILISEKTWDGEAFKEGILRVDRFKESIELAMEKPLSEDSLNRLIVGLNDSNRKLVIEVASKIENQNDASLKLLMPQLVEVLRSINIQNLLLVTNLIDSYSSRTNSPLPDELGSVLSDRLSVAQNTDEKLKVFGAFRALKLQLNKEAVSLATDLLDDSEPSVVSGALYTIAIVAKAEIPRLVPKIREIIDTSDKRHDFSGADRIKRDAIFTLSQCEGPTFKGEVLPYFLSLNKALIVRIKSIDGSKDEALIEKSALISSLCDMSKAIVEKTTEEDKRKLVGELVDSLLYALRTETRNEVDNFSRDKAKNVIVKFGELSKDIIEKERESNLISPRTYREMMELFGGK